MTFHHGLKHSVALFTSLSLFSLTVREADGSVHSVLTELAMESNDSCSGV